MKILERKHKVFRFDRHSPPAIKVDPGEALIVETTDSFDDQFDVSRPGTLELEVSNNGVGIDLERAMPMTGPVYIRGAEPGDVLATEILGLVATGNGFILPGFHRLLKPMEGTVQERLPIRIAGLRQGAIQFSDDLQLPYAMMIGSLGVAPAGAPANTSTPGEYGGNHDCLHFRQGTRLYLQVQVPGALVSLGDVHAAMGDGESAGTALECAGEASLRFHLYKDKRLPGPVLETETDWMVYGYGPTIDEAIAMAGDNAIDLLAPHLGAGPSDALMLLAAVGHLRLNEIVNPSCSARIELAKAAVGALLGDVTGAAVAQAEVILPG